MKKIHKLKPYFESIEFSWSIEDRFIFQILMLDFIRYYLGEQKCGETFTIKFEVTKTIYGEKNKNKN